MTKGIITTAFVLYVIFMVYVLMAHRPKPDPTFYDREVRRWKEATEAYDKNKKHH